MKPTDITWVNFSQNTAATFDVATPTTGKRIKLAGAILVAGAAVGIQFKDSAGSPVSLSPNFPIGANGGFVLPTNDLGYLEPTTVSKKLTLTLDAAVQVSGSIGYFLID